MLEETGTKVSISTVKRVLYRHNLKGRSARRIHCSKTAIKKTRFATAHGDKDHTFWRNILWSNEKIYNFLAIMTIIMFGGKRGGLQAEEHHPNCEARGWQHHVVGA